MNRASTCCFMGPRKLPGDEIGRIVARLDREADRLIGQGATDFISGGVPGFDLLAAALIFAKKEMGMDVRLIFALPCGQWGVLRSGKQRELYRNLLAEADEVIHVSKRYSLGCVKRRDRFMVDRSAHCIFARLYPFGGTDRAIRRAQRMGLRAVNVAECFGGTISKPVK